MTAASATAEEAAAGDKAAEERAAGERAALVAGVFCYFFWGFFPLLFKAAAWAGASAWEMVAWRSIWALVVAAAVAAATGRLPAAVKALTHLPTLGWLLLSGLLIGTNWSLFVLAVNAGHTLDASLGYYLNPLLTVAAGMALFRERIGAAGWTAIVLAAAGVALVTMAYGKLPLAALGMATSFCAYSVIRKRVAVDALTGLLIECLVLFLPALAYGLWLQSKGIGHAAQPLAGTLLFLAGPATVAPLTTFAWAARRMPLSTMGFIQFISPTMQFFIGLAMGEHLNALGLTAFAFIWAGVGVYAVTAWWKLRRVELRPSPPAGEGGGRMPAG